MVELGGSVSGKASRYRLGVLFVHGIGDQQQYSTLARFGGALQRWLRQWEVGRQRAQSMRDRVARPAVVDILAVDAHPGDRDDPAHAEMEVTAIAMSLVVTCTRRDSRPNCRRTAMRR